MTPSSQNRLFIPSDPFSVHYTYDISDVLYLYNNYIYRNGQYQFRLVESHDVRQNLVKLYEVIDSRSKQIMNLKYDHGREPSAVSQKIQKNIRVYASTYLQENLLSLPALPTKEKLKEIREEKERFAEERRLELMRKKEMQKEQEIASAAAAAKKELSMSKLEVSFSVLDSKLRLSPTFTRKAKAVFGIKNDSNNTNRNSTGWTAEHKFTDTQEAELDPFELQRQQLLGYISQAQQAKRFDEVATLKESLREIEALMEEQRET
jgi:rabenosyn-5